MPVSTDGPPEEPPYEQPLAYSESTEPVDGPALPPLGLAPIRWYRQPWALFVFGTVSAIVLALVIYAIFELVSSDGTQTVDPTTTTTTPPAVVVPGPIRTVTETTEVPAEPTTTPAPAPTHTQVTTTTPPTTTQTAPPTTTEITITLPRIPLPTLPPRPRRRRWGPEVGIDR